jgi:hypothetical protein
VPTVRLTSFRVVVAGPCFQRKLVRAVWFCGARAARVGESTNMIVVMAKDVQGGTWGRWIALIPAQPGYTLSKLVHAMENRR